MAPSSATNAQAEHEIRRKFTWIVFPDIDNIAVSIPGADVSFEIRPGLHEGHQEIFYANVDAMLSRSVRMAKGGLATPMLQLDMASPSTGIATSDTATPRDEAIYYYHEKIGKGSFGKVYRVRDVSTGNIYAGKTFDPSECKQEVAIMRAIEHENIVRFVNYLATPDPLIVMEYLPRGDLHGVHLASPLTFKETVIVLCQALEALTYLNSHGFVHRDIKPSNILVSCRDPLVIKLADLGLAKNDRNGSSKFQTWGVGTPLYAAPETYEREGEAYTYAVDIWSLGVVALELAYGLPRMTTRDFNSGRWLKELFKFVRDLDSDQLIDFLSNSMLCYKPDERLLPHQCLEKVRAINRKLDNQKALQSPSTQEAYHISPRTPTEKASGSTTVKHRSNSKQQRSLAPSSHGDARNKTAIRRGPDSFDTLASPQTYPIANASTWSDGERGSMYESVLQLLDDIRLGGDESTDSRTSSLVHELCRSFKQMGITEITRSTDEDAGRTILTAAIEARKFTLASLTSSDRAISVADLAEYLNRMMNQLEY